MTKTKVRCDHCDGKGVCKRGDDGVSCDTCLTRRTLIQHSISGRRKTVACTFCKGKGYNIEDM